MGSGHVIKEEGPDKGKEDKGRDDKGVAWEQGEERGQRQRRGVVERG